MLGFKAPSKDGTHAVLLDRPATPLPSILPSLKQRRKAAQ